MCVICSLTVYVLNLRAQSDYVLQYNLLKQDIMPPGLGEMARNIVGVQESLGPTGMDLFQTSLFYRNLLYMYNIGLFEIYENYTCNVLHGCAVFSVFAYKTCWSLY